MSLLHKSIAFPASDHQIRRPKHLSYSKLAEYLSDLFVYDKVCPVVIRRAAEVYERKLISPVIVYKSCRRINIQARTADYEHLRFRYYSDSLSDDVLIQRLFIQHNIRADNSAAGAVRHTGTVIHFIGRIRLSAHRAIAAQYAAVKLQHLFAACRLMQPIYILSDDRAQLSLLLKLRKLEMRGIGLYVIDNELSR